MSCRISCKRVLREVHSPKKTFLLQNMEKLKGESLTLTSLRLKALSLKAQPKKFKDGARLYVATR